MPRKSAKPNLEVIDLVDSDDDSSVVVVNESTSGELQISNFNLLAGTMVSTPYGVGEVIENKYHLKAENQSRKRPRNHSMSPADTSTQAGVNYDDFVSVQLTYGLATLQKSIVKPVFSSYQSDLMRCQPRMRFNDNLINFVVQRMIPSQNISILSTYSLSTIRNRLSDTELTLAQKKLKFRKLLPVPIDQLNHLVIPLNSDMHWSLIVICNLHKIIERAQFICKLKAEATSQVDLVNCTPTVKRAKLKQCLDAYDLPQQVELQWKSEEVPCLIHLDSANLHRIQHVSGLLRKFLSVVLDLNSSYKPMVDSAMDEENENVVESIAPVIDATTLPGIHVSVPQQANNYDCGPLMLQFCEKFVSSPPDKVNADFVRNRGEAYFSGMEWKSLSTQTEAYRQQILNAYSSISARL